MASITNSVVIAFIVVLALKSMMAASGNVLSKPLPMNAAALETQVDATMDMTSGGSYFDSDEDEDDEVGAHRVGPAGGIAELTSVEDTYQVLKSDGIRCIEFATEWCELCLVIAPRLHLLSQAMPRVRFYKVDVDKVLDLAMDFGVGTVPTFVICVDSDCTQSVSGAKLDDLRSTLEAVLRRK
ncbi:Thioredoxin domain-containing protein [Plasmodiophora brassicae]|uniref:Thioredoxin domain-containing protein n=1 Tax=Plasmodiophora brassicae TaxID=37360 RepID=A0A0G4IVH8_PLABS|nr:hypothetical protein PBRA_001216 [Plasmodiophora brassicae]SPQ97326.1 unnamed protein product [Plasmodiophora brassicae]